MNAKTQAELGPQQIAEQKPAEVAERSASMFERLARDPTVDVAKLEKLVELQERAEARNAKAAFAAAFAQMQGEIPVITKEGKIEFTGRDGKQQSTPYLRYEDLDRVIKPILQRHGFSLMHKRTMTDKTVTVQTILMHQGGHSEATEFSAIADTSGSKNAIQALGSTDQYGRRYNTVGILNIASGGQDDDGRKGGGGPLVSEDQADLLDSLIKEVKADPKAFCKYFKVGKIEELPAQAYNDAVAMLEAKRRRG